MPVGACGICCDVCVLNELGTCSSCGPGRSIKAGEKLAAQERLLAGRCKVLSCAHAKGVDYCMRDCPAFPCDKFRGYPFSEQFLGMQKRRRAGNLFVLGPTGSFIEVPELLWEEVCGRDMGELLKCSLFQQTGPMELSCTSLGKRVFVDLKRRRIVFEGGGRRPSPLLEVVVLSHLSMAKDLPLKQSLLGLKDLKASSFFEGSHRINTTTLKRFLDNQLVEYKVLEDRLSAQVVSMGDLGLRFQVFPRVPVWLVYWRGDEEFPSEVNFLFDGSVQEQMPTDAIWGTVHIVMEAIFHALMPGGEFLH